MPRRSQRRPGSHIQGARYSLRFPTNEQALEALGIHLHGNPMKNKDELYGWLMRRLTEETHTPAIIHGNLVYLRVTAYGRQRVYQGKYPPLVILINAFLDLSFPDEHLPNKGQDFTEFLEVL